MNPEDYLLEEEDKELTPEDLMGSALEADPTLLAAREQRDADLANTALFQGITDIGTGLASQGRVSSNNAVFDAIRKNANTKVEDARDVAKTKSKSMADFIKAKIGAKRSEENNRLRDEALEIRKGELEARREDNRIKQGLQNEARQQKITEREQLLETPFGKARTADDAKQIKSAAEMKDNFDRKIQELIDLRNDKGAEVFDRDAVGRGKQLSKELLLLYKDLSKLGVLSQSDEKILNEIIPSDPLQWNASSLVGQDPTMTKLTKFKDDTNADFNSRLKTRLRDGAAKPKPTPEQIAAELKRRGLR